MNMENSKNGQGNTEDPSAAPGGQPLRAGKALPIIKIAIFIIVVVAAISIVFSSITRKSRVKQASGEAGASSNYLESCGEKLYSMSNLNEAAQETDFVFLVIPDEEGKIPRDVASTIETVVSVISEKGVRAATFTLNPGSPDRGPVIKTYRIDTFPAVLAIGKGCSADLVKGKITEDSLLRSYLIASRPVSSGCCP